MSWRNAALIIAPLFLNFVFWIGPAISFSRFSGRPSSLLVDAAAGMLAAGLFFLGPAVIASTTDSLWAAVTDCFGPVLSVVLRSCAIVFLALWIAQMAAVDCWWLSGNFPPAPQLQTVLATGAILLLVLLTSQTAETVAKLGSFSIQLAIAMAIAALIRVHEGWPAIVAGFPNARDQPVFPDLITDGQDLMGFVAPFAFLAAGLCSKASIRQVRMTALLGIAAPIAASLTVMGAIGVATWSSHFYRPSLQPTIAMALNSGISKEGVKAILLIAAVLGLGAMRFSVAALEECAGIVAIPKRFRWIALGALFSAIVWIATHEASIDSQPVFQSSIIAIAAAGAVLTAQAIVGRAPRWATALALIAGAALPHAAHLWWSGDPWWWSPWLLWCYALSLAIGIVGRIFTRLLPTPSSSSPIDRP